MNPEKTHLYKKQYQQPIEEGIKNNISNQSRKKRLRIKENQRRLLPLIAENALSINTYTKKSSYTMVVTRFVGVDNAKFAGDWILHINLLIGTPRSFR